MTLGLIKKALSRKARMKARLKEYIDSHKEFKRCGVCRENCESDFLCCRICENASHRKCLKLSKKNAQKLRDTNAFICSNACYNSVLPFFDLTNDIELVCDLLGDGDLICVKCKRGCRKHMARISCSNCEGWVHKSCSKLSDNDFENKKYYFCSNKCRDNAIIPEELENAVDGIANMRRLVQENNKNGNISESTPKTSFISVKDHFLDVKCSYVEAHEVTSSLLSDRKSEITIFQSNIRSLNANLASS